MIMRVHRVTAVASMIQGPYFVPLFPSTQIIHYICLKIYGYIQYSSTAL